MTEAYIVIYTDPTSDLSPWSLPYREDGLNVYRSLDAAKKALSTASDDFEAILPVAYGHAYPYDNTTFEAELQKKGYATYAWGIITDDDGDETRIPLGILRLTIQ